MRHADSMPGGDRVRPSSATPCLPLAFTRSAGHRAAAEAIRSGDAPAAAMTAHIDLVSDVPLLADED